MSPLYSRLGNSLLRVRGLIMDSISFLSPTLSRTTTISDMAAVWKAVEGFTSNPIYDKVPRLHAFFETMGGGTKPAGLGHRQLKAHTEACLRCFDYDGQFLGRKDAKATSDITEHGLQASRRPWQHIQGCLHNRRIAVTRRGYYCLVWTWCK